jgi:hypothetical protein
MQRLLPSSVLAKVLMGHSATQLVPDRNSEPEHDVQLFAPAAEQELQLLWQAVQTPPLLYWPVGQIDRQRPLDSLRPLGQLVQLQLSGPLQLVHPPWQGRQMGLSS